MTTLHLMVGLPCSGKTTLAKALEKDLDALRLTPDDWQRFFFGQDATHPDHDQRHSKIEALQWQVAVRALERSVDVILDFGFWSRAERYDYTQRAAELGVSAKIHFLDVPFDELLRRVRIRNTQNPEVTTIIPVLKMVEYLPMFETPDIDEPGLEVG